MHQQFYNLELQNLVLIKKNRYHQYTMYTRSNQNIYNVKSYLKIKHFEILCQI